MANKKDKKEVIKLVIENATARYAWINEPDTKFNPEGLFKVDLVKSKDAPEVALLTEHAEKAFELAKEELKAKGGKHAATAKKLEMHLPFDDEYDDEGEETGNVIFKAKSTASGVSKKTGKPWARKIPVFDSQGTHLKSPPGIFGGSIINTEVEVNYFSMPATKKAGVNLRLESVQIVELSQGSGGASASSHGFGAIDGGYVADKEPSFNTDNEDNAEGTEGTASTADEDDDF